MAKETKPNFADRLLWAVAWFLLMVIGLGAVTGGIGLWLNPNPKMGQVGIAIAVDLFITLGTASILGALSHAFPNLRALRWLADETLKKLCLFVVAFGLGLLIVLLWP